MPYLIAQIAAILALAAVLFFVLGFWYGRGRRAPAGKPGSIARSESAPQPPVEEAADERVLAELQMVRKQFAEATTRIGDLEDELQRVSADVTPAGDPGAVEAASETPSEESAGADGPGGLLPERAGEDPDLGQVYAVRPDNFDDLTEIRGIGKPLCRKLNALGIYRFEQIAGWTDEQLAAICDRMSLGNRSQAAKWMVQAKKLVS